MGYGWPDHSNRISRNRPFLPTEGSNLAQDSQGAAHIRAKESHQRTHFIHPGDVSDDDRSACPHADNRRD
jgi:hypothetical protein